MSLLTVNGIELPISRDSVKRGEIEIGSSGRAYSGAAWKSVRARKKTLGLKTAPMALADCDAWAALLNGQAVNWDFESDTYSLQGHAATIVGSAGRNSAVKKFGSYSLNVPNNATVGVQHSASWTLGFGSVWTVAYWCNRVGVWSHVVRASDGSEYVNGVAAAYSDHVLIAGGVLTAAEDNVASVYIDDLFALPAVVPASWPAAMCAHGAQLLASPSFSVAGDLLGSTLTMQARAVEREPLETAAGVLWRLGVEMEEA